MAKTAAGLFENWDLLAMSVAISRPTVPPKDVHVLGEP